MLCSTSKSLIPDGLELSESPKETSCWLTTAAVGRQQPGRASIMPRVPEASVESCLKLRYFTQFQ